MQLLSQIAFFLLATTAIYLFTRRITRIRRNILLGKESDYSNDKPARWRNLLLLAFGQKKMFANPLVAVMHFVIYAGFIIINIEVLEIMLDGLLGTHRLFAKPLGDFYFFLIDVFEWLAVGVITVCIVFLARRNLLKIKRFISHDLDGWPRSDANYILLSEIFLMSLFLLMNAADPSFSFSVSHWLKPLFNGWSAHSLHVFERVCWWLHIAGIFAFLNYLPFSKHLHILLAFPNAWYARLQPPGKMNNMPTIQQEVLYAMQPELAPADVVAPTSFGAKDVTDLSWRNLLDAYTCTECGRCSAACPATLTGKKLSPRKIMMDTRDRLESLGRAIDAGDDSSAEGKTLLYHYISVEELRACTSCNACVQACPASISPLEIILELRRCLIMEESSAPQEWNVLFGNVENNFAPWKFSPDDRDAWVQAGS
ncbi:MAG TPA: (Fe-S)-binding protein [Flavihumibacter sp.]|nr:(Fe-S)-binding protein [Flavihumibacter sp.]HQD09181.1 (Fe-S)-binding protein [Flavihumibacter sp.]